MNYFIGIDGGGTKSTCVVTDYNLHVIFKAYGGPTNFLTGNPDEAAENIFDLICKIKNELIVNDEDIASVCIGSAGAGREEDITFITQKFNEIKIREKCNIKNIHVVSDVMIALEGAFRGNAGIVLIAGTGSICYGKNSKGEIFRVGGMGKILGDEGSGYSLGNKGLRIALRSYDGRCLAKNLMNEIFSFMSAESSADVIKKVYKENFSIASIAEVILAVAEKGDEAALNILHEESEELLMHLHAILPRLNESDNKLVLSGSLLANKNIYSDIVTKRINKILPGIQIVEAMDSPEMGAVMLAKKKFA